ncbi:MAG: hypothetical protein ACFCUX_05475 [Candidatus Methylacidiphilales bacterium]
MENPDYDDLMIRTFPLSWFKVLARLPVLFFMACNVVMTLSTNASEAADTWVSLKLKNGTIQHGHLISRSEQSIHLVRSGTSTLLPVSSLSEESLALLDARHAIPSTPAVSQQMSELKASLRDSRSSSYVVVYSPARLSTYRIEPLIYSSSYSSYPSCYPYSAHSRSGSTVTVRVRF